jgi:hypothetical protein
MMQGKEVKIAASRDLWSRSIKLYYMEVIDGRRSIATSVTLEPFTEGSVGGEFLALPEETAQRLFDELWALGLRPADGTGNGGHIQALNNHLNEPVYSVSYGDLAQAADFYATRKADGYAVAITAVKNATSVCEHRYVTLGKITGDEGELVCADCGKKIEGKAVVISKSTLPVEVDAENEKPLLLY